MRGEGGAAAAEAGSSSVGRGNEASKQKTNYGTASFACPPQRAAP